MTIESLLATTASAAAAATSTGDTAFLFWGFILVGAAIIVLALELLLPTGGLLALVTGILLVGSLVAFFQYNPSAGWLALVLMIVLGPICAFYGFKIWMNSKLAKNLILEDEGPATTHAASLLGVVGVAETPLRPVGTVRVNGQRHDALAELGIIEVGTAIKVIEELDNQLKVRAVEPQEKEST